MATKDVVDGLRELANDLEKYGNIDVLSVIPRKLNDELEKTIPMLKKLESELKEINEFTLPIENSKRTLVVIKKNAKTALLYPRKYSEIKKMK